MSMPFIIPGFGTRERAITDIIESTALQKTALAHILNAEGEKIQAALLSPGISIDRILDVNDSVLAVMYGITRLELILEAKLNVLPDLSVLDTFLPDLPTLPVAPITPIAPIIPILSVQKDSDGNTDNANCTGIANSAADTGKNVSSHSTGGSNKADNSISTARTDNSNSINSTNDTSHSRKDRS